MFIRRSTIAPVHRRGTAAIWGLICLLIATLLTSLISRSVIQSQRQWKQELQATQAQWLLQAGSQRLQAQLAAGGQLADGQWAVTISELPEPGTVEYHWRPAPSETAAERTVEISAIYPTELDTAVRQRGEWTWNGKVLKAIVQLPTAKRPVPQPTDVAPQTTTPQSSSPETKTP